MWTSQTELDKDMPNEEEKSSHGYGMWKCGCVCVRGKVEWIFSVRVYIHFHKNSTGATDLRCETYNKQVCYDMH